MRIKNEHIRFVVEWILSHPEIEGFTIKTPIETNLLRLQVGLDVGCARYGFDVNLDTFMTYQPEMVLREALETAWHDISHKLKNQSSYRKSRYS